MLNSPDTKIPADVRTSLRRALQACATWPDYAAALDLKLASMSREQYVAAANCLGIDIAKLVVAAADADATPDTEADDNSQITDILEAIEMSHDARPHSPAEVTTVLKSFEAVRSHASANAAALFDAINTTVFSKQGGCATAKQMRTLQSIARQAKAKADKAATVDAPAPIVPPAPKAPDMPPVPPSAPSDPVQAALAVLAQAMAKPAAPVVDEDWIVEMIRKHAPKANVVTIDLRAPGAMPKVKEGVLIHYKLPAIFAAVMAGVNVMLVGTAGSGKTTICEQMAHMAGKEFSFTGAIDSAYKLSGFVDAQGRIVYTAFRRAYEHGGWFLFDEMDGSLPGAVLAFNAALANGHADFPDGMVKRHPDFRAIAACNTFGRGADRQYVGRLQLDAASLDRFATVEFDVDTGLEAAMVGLDAPSDAPRPIKVNPVSDANQIKVLTQTWFETVQRYRRAVETSSVRHLVSPRATLMGVKLLVAGWSQKDVEESVIWKGLKADDRAKVKAAL